jgi:hypothetical protein
MAHFAFLLVQAVALFLVAPFFAFLTADGPPGTTLWGSYWSFAPKVAFWSGAYALPASVIWQFLFAVAANHARPSVRQILRVVAWELLVVTLWLLAHIASAGELQPAERPEWSDVRLFGGILAFSFVASLALSVVAFPIAMLIRERRQRRAEETAAP